MNSDSRLEVPLETPQMPALEYAGFLSRFIAHVIDVLILGVVFWTVPSQVQYLGLVVGVLYYPALEGSAAQATIGKRVMNLIVTDEQGARISVRISFIRFLMSFVSNLFMLVGYLFFFFTKRKQTLHDLVAQTVVLHGRRAESMPEAWIEQLRNWAR